MFKSARFWTALAAIATAVGAAINGSVGWPETIGGIIVIASTLVGSYGLRKQGQ